MAKNLDITREGRSLTGKLRLVAALTWPAVAAQMSNIVMEYIDASMVGSLGAEPSASIGLVASSTWLIWGLCVAVGTGFSVQVAHLVGAAKFNDARRVVCQGVVAAFLAGVLIAAVSVAIGPFLPVWLGGKGAVVGDAAAYFIIFSGAMPLIAPTFAISAFLRASGNMAFPGAVNVAMCLMDVVFNFFLIFEPHTYNVLGMSLAMPGAGMGVAGAALGTSLAYSIGGLVMWVYLVRRSPSLSHPFAGTGLRQALHLTKAVMSRAVTISWPIALERTVMCGAQIFVTAIVAPLGNASIAANSFAVTAESLCYAPGYGVGDAGTTLVGQCLGAGKRALAISYARISIITGMVLMGLLGVVLWIFAPEMMAMFTPVAEVVDLGARALRTEAWAEPMFGAAIVTYCVLVGAGYTKVPAVINFSSIWVVRVTIAAALAPVMGLHGVWLAMCIELCVRGAVFLVVFLRGRWINAATVTDDVPSPGTDGEDPIIAP